MQRPQLHLFISLVLFSFSYKSFSNCSLLLKGLTFGIHFSPKSLISKSEKDEILYYARELSIKDEYVETFIDTLDNLEFKISQKDLKFFLLFLEGLPDKKKKVAISHLYQLKDELQAPSNYTKILGIGNNVLFEEEVDKILKNQKIDIYLDKEKINRHIKKYLSIRESISKYEKKELEKRKKSGSFSEQDFNTHMKEYEKLTFQCKASVKTNARKFAEKDFVKFRFAASTLIAGGAYYIMSQDDERSGYKIAAQFGYEMLWSYYSGKYMGKIIAGNSGHVTKAFKKFMFGRTINLADIFLYSLGAKYIFGQSTNYSEVNDLLADENKRELIAKLEEDLSKSNHVRDAKERVVEIIRDYAPLIAPDIKFDGKKISQLPDHYFAREDVKEEIFNLIIHQKYLNREAPIATGNGGVDRYVFHTLYGLAMLPKDLFLDLYMYNSFCMGQINRKNGFLKAAGIFALNKLTFDWIYYSSRRGLIDQ